MSLKLLKIFEILRQIQIFIRFYSLEQRNFSAKIQISNLCKFSSKWSSCPSVFKMYDIFTPWMADASADNNWTFILQGHKGL